MKTDAAILIPIPVRSVLFLCTYFAQPAFGICHCYHVYCVNAELKFSHAHLLGKDCPGRHGPNNAAKITLTYMAR